MRPLIRPGLHRAWRDGKTLQLGLDPDHAVVVTDVDPSARTVIDALDGRTDVAALLARADRAGLDRPTTLALLKTLSDAGVLDDADADAAALRCVTPAERDRLTPTLNAHELVVGRVEALRRLQLRHAASVVVSGSGQLAASIAVLLAAQGVGRLSLPDGAAEVEPADVLPIGLSPSTVGRPRVEALREHLRAIAPSTVIARREPTRPDLVVLAADDEPDRGRALALLRDGIPHLVAHLREAAGCVGPLVLPGETACLQCLDLHRCDLDPGWPAVLSQAQAQAAESSELVGDAALVTMVATLAALHALTWLDGGSPRSIDGTLIVTLPDGDVRRRSWRPHVDCGCTWESVTTPRDSKSADQEPSAD